MVKKIYFITAMGNIGSGKSTLLLKKYIEMLHKGKEVALIHELDGTKKTTKIENESSRLEMKK